MARGNSDHQINNYMVYETQKFNDAFKNSLQLTFQPYPRWCFKIQKKLAQRMKLLTSHKTILCQLSMREQDYQMNTWNKISIIWEARKLSPIRQSNRLKHFK